MPQQLSNPRGSQKARLFNAGESVAGTPAATPAQLAIEWVGRAGHPSSYGLLGGVLATPGGFDAALDVDRPYRRSLAGIDDETSWGLPAEYRSALAPWASTIRFTVAAHGIHGSSPRAFERLGEALAVALDNGEWRDDPAAIWEAMGRASGPDI